MSYVEELFSLKDKVAVVIGAGGVLAGSMATALGKAGAKVAVLDLNEKSAIERADVIKTEANVDTLAISLDATDREALVNAAEKISKELGGIDILVNAPGINSGTPFFEITEEEWDKIIKVNLSSMYLACQIFGEVMVKQGKGGSIINISSASSGPPLSKVFTYSITKAGVNNLTQFLANDLAKHKIRVNAIAPGFFPAEQNRKLLTEERTNQILGHTPMDRFGEASELSGATVWLASEAAASFVTGSIVRVDGGFTAKTI